VWSALTAVEPGDDLSLELKVVLAVAVILPVTIIVSVIFVVVYVRKRLGKQGDVRFHDAVLLFELTCRAYIKMVRKSYSYCTEWQWKTEIWGTEVPNRVPEAEPR